MGRIGVLLLLSQAAFCQAQAREHLSLPGRAQVQVGESRTDKPDPSPAQCYEAVTTERQIRWRFKTSSFIDEAQRDDYIHYRPCWTNGTVHLKGQSYSYQVRWPDILITTYPDGKEKLLQTGPKGNDPPTHSVVQRPKPVHFALPALAMIQLGTSSSDKPEEENCKSFVLTARAIRRRFQRYHALVEGEFHDSFGVFPCHFHGSVTVGGESYTFEALEGNLLSTDFPDHQWKLLGGSPSAPLDDRAHVVFDPDVRASSKP